MYMYIICIFKILYMLKIVFFWMILTTQIKNSTDRNPVCTRKWMTCSEH